MKYDVSMKEHERKTQEKHKTYRPKIKGDNAKICEAVELMAKAKRPLFIAVGG